MKMMHERINLCRNCGYGAIEVIKETTIQNFKVKQLSS